jgi:hypothetical protein
MHLYITVIFHGYGYISWIKKRVALSKCRFSLNKWTCLQFNKHSSPYVGRDVWYQERLQATLNTNMPKSKNNICPLLTKHVVGGTQ